MLSDNNMVELPPLRFVRETSRTSKVNMEAVVIDIDEQEIEDVDEVRKRLEEVDDLNTEADVGEGGFPSDEEDAAAAAAMPDLEKNGDEAIYAQVDKKGKKDKRKKNKKADIDPKKAKEEIKELEEIIEKASKGELETVASASPVKKERTYQETDFDFDPGELDEADLQFDEEMAGRRRRSSSYEDTIQKMDPELLKELGLDEGGNEAAAATGARRDDDDGSGSEKDLEARLEERASELIKDSAPLARRRSRSRSRSRPPALDTVEENYSKEYQESLYYKQNGAASKPTLNDIQESPSGASIQSEAIAEAQRAAAATEAAFRGAQQGDAPQSAGGDAEAEKKLGEPSKPAAAPKGKPMSLKEEAQFDIESEDMEKKKAAAVQEGAAGGDSGAQQDPLMRTNSIDEVPSDYEISDSEDDISVKTVEAVELDSSKADKADTETRREKASKEEKAAARKKSKSRERSAKEKEDRARSKSRDKRKKEKAEDGEGVADDKAAGERQK